MVRRYDWASRCEHCRIAAPAGYLEPPLPSAGCARVGQGRFRHRTGPWRASASAPTCQRHWFRPWGPVTRSSWTTSALTRSRACARPSRQPRPGSCTPAILAW